ncbi:MAG: hypothetical protein IOD12_05395 [Silvanigrellales bacterium]|nr:hypothetical protein [Silvanigrellales bacterium]
MLFRLGFFLFSMGLLSCNRSDSSGTSQGLVYSDLTDASRKNFDVCWAASSEWIPAQVRANLESKVVEQYNNRTPVSFRFGADPCSGAPGLEVRISSQTSTGGPACPSGAAATAHPFLKRSHPSTSGTRVGPGSDVTLCRESLKTIGTFGNAHFEKELAVVILHELGHVLGLAHEQDRLDVETADKACWASNKTHILATRADNAALKIKTLSVGAYDAQSIMNYCSAVRDTWKSWKNVVLSEGDVRTLESVFGATAVDASDMGTVPEKPPLEAGQPEIFVHCDTTLLRRCLITYAGGSGCLQTNRNQGECVSLPSPTRLAVPFNATKACMVARTSPQEKAAFVPGL